MPPRIAGKAVVMFSSYLYLIEEELLHACDKMKDRSDYETHLPR
jgi:hypothetical protein